MTLVAIILYVLGAQFFYKVTSKEIIEDKNEDDPIWLIQLTCFGLSIFWPFIIIYAIIITTPRKVRRLISKKK